jgi:hypothetical protein
MIEKKVISLGVKFKDKPYKGKEPPSSGGIIYVNKFEEPDEYSIKTMKIKNRSHAIFKNGFNHKK